MTAPVKVSRLAWRRRRRLRYLLEVMSRVPMGVTFELEARSQIKNEIEALLAVEFPCSESESESDPT